MPLAHVRVVLLRPRNPENVGAIARALKNFGVRDWALVDAACEDAPAARRLAVQSEELLDQAARPATLAEAVADCVWVVGTSPRILRGRRQLSPREVAAEACARAPSGKVALVFGDERSGLGNDELDRCHALSAIGTDDAQPSVNLAQAVLLYLYELRMAATAGLPPPLLPTAATDGELERLRAQLAELLRKGGFLHDETRQGLTELVAPWRRARLTRDEAKLWMAALRALGRRL